MVGRKPAPRVAPPVDVRERVLAAATRLFAAHGFDGTSLQAIADEVGVAKPSVLHHFPSKEALREGVLAAMVEHWSEALPRLLLAATAGEGRFDAVFGELISFFLADADRARLLVREALDRPAETRRTLLAEVRPWLAAIAAYIEKGKRHGEHFPDVDAEAYVLHVLTLTISALAVEETYRALLGTEARDPSRARYVRELTRIAKASLFAPPAEEEGVPTPKRPARAPKER